MIINTEINHEFSFLILYLDGNFEFDSSEKLEQKIISEIDKHSIFDIIINFKKIKYINSYSLNGFVRLYSSMLKKGVKFYISDPSENTRNVFRTTSLHLIIPIYSNNNEVFKEKR